MALINCPECRKEISDTVKICPNCGYKIRRSQRKHKAMNKGTKRVLIIVAVFLVITLGLIGIVQSTLSLSDTEKAQVVTLNGLIKDVIGNDIEGKSKEQLLSLKENCQDIEEEYINLQWKQKRKIEDYEHINEISSSIDNEINNINQREIQNVINIINDVGEVTLESQELIENAKMAYNELDDEQKGQVTNFGQIEVYERQYDEIRINETINQINSIGRISLENDSEKKIEAAESLYNNLPQELRASVSNYDILVDKRNKFDKLNKYKKLLLNAKNKMNGGNLNEAKRILEKLPSKFKYDGTKVSTLKKQLSSKSDWLSLCGRWITTSGQKRVDQVWDYDGSSEGWYRNFDKGEESLSIRCKLLKNGKVKVVTEGSLPIYTSYSVISEGLESGTVELSTTKTMSGMGTIKIDKYTTMTISTKGITVNYYMVNPNEDQYFTYKYKTTMTFGKRAEKY